MIVLHNHNALIITPPKTGSTSLHSTLCEFNIGFRLDGPQGDNGEIDKHTSHVAFNYKDFSKFVVTREPSRRFLSLYEHYRRYKEDVSFDEYIKLWSNRELEWFYMWNLHRYVEGFESYKCLRLEYLESDLLDKIGISVTMYKHNVYNSFDPSKIVPSDWIDNDILEDR